MTLGLSLKSAYKVRQIQWIFLVAASAAAVAAAAAAAAQWSNHAAGDLQKS